jgi:hypothetical protein
MKACQAYLLDVHQAQMLEQSDQLISYQPFPHLNPSFQSEHYRLDPDRFQLKAQGYHPPVILTLKA